MEARWYMKSDRLTSREPARNQMEGYWPKSGMAPTTVKMTDRALAKFFMMLSEYLTTMPTMRPPKTCRRHVSKDQQPLDEHAQLHPSLHLRRYLAIMIAMAIEHLSVPTEAATAHSAFLYEWEYFHVS